LIDCTKFSIIKSFTYPFIIIIGYGFVFKDGVKDEEAVLNGVILTSVKY
jgi:hypothetical protein